MKYVCLIVAAIVTVLFASLAIHTGGFYAGPLPSLDQPVLAAGMFLPIASPFRFLIQSPDGLLHSKPVDDAIAAMTAAETVEDSAIAFIQSVPGLIASAVSAAQANGATKEELQPLTALGTELQSKTDALTAALQPPPSTNA